MKNKNPSELKEDLDKSFWNKLSFLQNLVEVGHQQDELKTLLQESKAPNEVKNSLNIVFWSKFFFLQNLIALMNKQMAPMDNKIIDRVVKMTASLFKNNLDESSKLPIPVIKIDNQGKPIGKPITTYDELHYRVK